MAEDSAGSEACERVASLGARSVLVTYMTGTLLYADREATARFHAFLAAAALASLGWGWAAERFLGRGRAVRWVALLALAGLATLALWDTRAGLAAGLALLALGAGGQRPGRAPAAGGPPGSARSGAPAGARGWSSVAADLGAAGACLAAPELLARAGPAAAFALPGAALALSLGLLLAGRRAAGAEPPTGPRPHGFARVAWRAVRRLGTTRPGQHWLEGARDRHPADAVAGARAVLRVLAVLAPVPVFWSLFDQAGSAGVVQASRMNLSLGGWSLRPAQLLAANPALLLLLVPLLGRVVFPLLARRGAPPSPLARMKAGLFLVVLAFVAAAGVQAALDAGAAPHVLWQLPQHLLLTAGEVLLALAGLEFGAAQAPPAMRSAVVAAWSLAIAAGNLVTWLVNALLRIDGTAYFLFFAALALAAALAFVQVARRWHPTPAQPG